jgi:hypothetical protein
MPDQGLRTPSNSLGNLIGSITASYKAFFAPSKPDISSQLTLGFSDTIAYSRADFILSDSSFELKITIKIKYLPPPPCVTGIAIFYFCFSNILRHSLTLSYLDL